MRSNLDQSQTKSIIGLSWNNTKAKIRDFLIYGFGERMLRQIGELIPRYSLIGNTPFFEAEQFSWVPELETNWKLIRQELDAILKYKDQLPDFQAISTDQAYLIGQDSFWKTYFLYGYGFKAEKNCERCPETTRLIEKIPGMKTAFFSILFPSTHIPEHRGPYKGVIRCLLGLKIPEPQEKCRIRVDNEIRYWEEGKCLLLDDSFQHEAWNETDDVRVVLFLDIVRPMRFPLSLINHLFLQVIAWSPFIQEAKANQMKWDRKLEDLFARK